MVDWYVFIMQPTPTSTVRDFSGSTKKVTFTADGDTFFGVPRVPTFLFTDLVAKVNAAKEMPEQVAAVTEFFNVVLDDTSAALMMFRLSDKKNPVDIPQALDIVAYLVEVYGERPTPPSSRSSDGSTTEETGTTSTAGALDEVSIPLSSPSLDS